MVKQPTHAVRCWLDLGLYFSQFPSVCGALSHSQECLHVKEGNINTHQGRHARVPQTCPLVPLSCVLCTPTFKQSSKCSAPAHVVAVRQGQKAGSTSGWADGEKPCRVELEPESKYKGNTKPSPGYQLPPSHRLPPLTDLGGMGLGRLWGGPAATFLFLDVNKDQLRKTTGMKALRVFPWLQKSQSPSPPHLNTSYSHPVLD